MTSNWQGQHMLRDPQQTEKNSAWAIALGITLFGVFLSASVQAAVFTVNTNVDVVDANPGDGICDAIPPKNFCTLRAAIQEANALAGTDQIILPSLPAPNVYRLFISTELAITENLTITGGGASNTIIDGNRSLRPNSGVLRTSAGVTVNIGGVTISNGGRMTGNGGGISINDGATVTLIDSTVSGNSASAGGGISNDGATVMLINSTVSGNSSAAGNGGGIFNENLLVGSICRLTLINSTVSGNSSAAGNGGGIFNGNLLRIAHELTLINSTVSGNSANNGGGIYNDGGRVALTNSAVSGNDASNLGGGLVDSLGAFPDVILTNSTVSGNSASAGGGIANVLGNVTLINTTVTGNRAASHGGGILGTGSVTNLFNATITDNLANANLDFDGVGGGVFLDSAFGNTFNFQNTILAGNSTRVFDLVNPRVPSDCAGMINSNGNNLMRTLDNCTVTGSPVTVAAPQLGPLQNNGGPTQTHALLAGSPAIDNGNPGGCRDNLGALLTTDQRGFPRPAVGCDIGAYELFTGSNTSVVAALLPSSRSVQVGTAATVFGTMINTGQSIAAACSITPLTGIPATFQFQTTNPATNQVTGLPNTAASIAPGATQSFFLAVTPTAPIAPSDVQFSFDCANSDPAPINVGLNTLLLSASATPVPDIVALAATTTNDGIVNIPGTNGTGAFAVATVNVGASATITASADTGSAALPVVINLCETNAATGQCISGIGPSVSTTINAGATPTFGIFVQGTGNVPFDPAANRIFVRFKDGSDVTRGSTSVAVRTQ